MAQVYPIDDIAGIESGAYWMADRHTNHYCQQIVMAYAREEIGQNMEKGHTANPRIEIKILCTAENRIRAAELKGRDSTEHAMTKGLSLLLRNFLLLYVLPSPI